MESSEVGMHRGQVVGIGCFGHCSLRQSGAAAGATQYSQRSSPSLFEGGRDGLRLVVRRFGVLGRTNICSMVVTIFHLSLMAFAVLSALKDMDSYSEV